MRRSAKVVKRRAPSPFHLMPSVGRGGQQGGIDAVNKGLALILGKELGALRIMTEHEFHRFLTLRSPGDGLERIVQAVGSQVGSGVGGELDDFIGVEGVEAAGDTLTVGGIPFAMALQIPGAPFIAQADLGMGLAGDGDEFEPFAINLRQQVVA